MTSKFKTPRTQPHTQKMFSERRSLVAKSSSAIARTSVRTTVRRSTRTATATLLMLASIAMLSIFLWGCASSYSEYKEFSNEGVYVLGADPYHEASLVWFSAKTEEQKVKWGMSDGFLQHVEKGGTDYVKTVQLKNLTPGSLYFCRVEPFEKPNPPKSYMPPMRGLLIPAEDSTQSIYALGFIKDPRDQVYQKVLRHIARKDPTALMLFDKRMQLKGSSLPAVEYYRLLKDMSLVAGLLLVDDSLVDKAKPQYGYETPRAVLIAMGILDIKPEDKFNAVKFRREHYTRVRSFGGAYVVSNIDLGRKGLAWLEALIAELPPGPVILSLDRPLLSVSAIDQLKINTLAFFNELSERTGHHISILACGTDRSSYWEISPTLTYMNIGSIESTKGLEGAQLKDSIIWDEVVYDTAAELFNALGFSWEYLGPAYVKLSFGVEQPGESSSHERLRRLGLLPKDIAHARGGKQFAPISIELYTPDDELIRF